MRASGGNFQRASGLQLAFDIGHVQHVRHMLGSLRLHTLPAGGRWCVPCAVWQQLLHHIEQMLCTIDLDLRGPGGFARTLRGQHKAQRWFLRAHGQCRSQRAAHRAQLAGQRQLSGKFPALELACINLAAGGKDAQRNRQVKAAGILG